MRQSFNSPEKSHGTVTNSGFCSRSGEFFGCLRKLAETYGSVEHPLVTPKTAS
jgi:hypothetical protein